jgi:hypothetical protein
MQVIPITAYPEQTFRIVLDSVPYSWRVYWTAFDDTIKEIVGDDIDGMWYADIVGGGIEIKGMAIVTGCNMFDPYAYDQIGQLWLVDSEIKLTDPTYESLGVNHQLVYIPAADVASFIESTGQ